MNELVFDAACRWLEGGADHDISAFDYLNGSMRVEADRVREIIDMMFASYPAVGKADLRSRLRSRQDEQHLGAFFELALHHLMTSNGCAVEIHPAVPGSTKNPDFLVMPPRGEPFYLEATLATGRTRAQDAANARLARALQTIDEVHAPEFHLHVSTRGTPAQPITGRRLRSQLDGWLSAGAPGTLRYEEHGAVLRFFAVPRSVTAKVPRRAISSRMLRPNRSTAPAIRASVQKKANRYGVPDHPYIVAVNALGGLFLDETDVFDALFGTEFTMARSDDLIEPARHSDGAFWNSGRARCTRVSAVLCFGQLDPWRIGTCRSWLIKHPGPLRPLDANTVSLLPGNRVELVGSEAHTITGPTLRAVFKQWRDWPEDPS
jgi:hypothetical protein